MKPAVIFIAADHAGVEMKAHLIGSRPFLPWRDLGVMTEDPVDYPDVTKTLVHELEPRLGDALGVLICGSGQGVTMAANRFNFIRAALCWSTEVAALARRHNDANVLCLASRLTTGPAAVEILETFLAASFEGGRHERRKQKLCT